MLLSTFDKGKSKNKSVAIDFEVLRIARDLRELI